MNKIIKYIGILAILPLVLVALTPDLIGQADAERGPPPKSYGSATDDIVCGDRLCSTPEGEPDPINVSG
jgi:hypothetical protein